MTKVPCGGFKIDNDTLKLKEDGTLYAAGGGGSIPKPLTYDYMPEGYPSKSVGTVTLMEEQEVAFADNGDGSMIANSPVNLDIKLGDELTVIWDGVSYDVIVTIVQDTPTFGDLSMIGIGATTDYPFLYVGQGPFGSPMFAAADTSTTHTIKVMRQQVTYTTMDVNFIPNTIQRVGDDVIISSSTPDSKKKFRITVDDSGTILATEVT